MFFEIEKKVTFLNQARYLVETFLNIIYLFIKKSFRSFIKRVWVRGLIKATSGLLNKLDLKKPGEHELMPNGKYVPTWIPNLLN